MTQGDGRHIDPRAGALEGEGAAQEVSSEPAEPAPLDVWTHVPSRTSGEAGASYYDRPVLKEPVWIWAVPAYFFVGGAAGAASVLGETAEAIGGPEMAGLVKRARWLGAAGGALGTALLIYDLGRPGRFLHMLRVFRPSSPMSVGSWVLAAATPMFAASAVLPHSGGWLGRVGNAIGKAAAVLGLPLAGYTGVLLGSTAVPLWQAARHALPVLFMASAASSASALLDFADLNETESEVVRRFGIAAEATELVTAFVLEKQVSRTERVGEPLNGGISGSLWKTSTALGVVGLVLSLLPGQSRAKSIVSGLVGTSGGLCTRFAVFEAGKASARDPHATFAQQREGGGAAELRGSWRPLGGR
jgi:formate-dependent nitrite reductase membrane component NrfD